MGKRRLPNAPKATTKWRKGDACVSNPKNRKYRNEIKSNMMLPYQQSRSSKKGGYSIIIKNQMIFEREKIYCKGMDQETKDWNRFLLIIAISRF